MDRFGFFNECFGGELPISRAVRATDVRKVVVGSLLERTMIAANDRHIGVVVYVTNR